MPGFFPELGLALREREDRELTHLKAMASITRMIEQCRVGFEITIIPLPHGGYNVSHLPVDPEAVSLMRDSPWPDPPAPIAAPLIEAEIARRET